MNRCNTSEREAAAIMAALAAAVAASAAAAPAAVAADCRAVTDSPYHVAPSALSACGGQAWPLLTVTTRPDGGKDYNYLVNDRPTTVHAPPPGFDPLRASAAQLALWGVTPEQIQRTIASGQVTKADVERVRMVAPPAELDSVPGKSSTTATSTWSGYVDTGPAGTFHTAQIGYNEPPYIATPCPNGDAVFWVGIGGYPSTPLEQAGTDLAYGDHMAWWEIYPDNIIQAAPGGVWPAAGQQYLVSMSSQQNTVSFLFWDVTTGQKWSTGTEIADAPEPGNSASGSPSGPVTTTRRQSSPTTCAGTC
jgi:hypothetical protein